MSQQTGKLTTESPGVSEMMDELGRRAREAASELALCPGSQRNEALQAAADSIRDSADAILDAQTKLKLAGQSHIDNRLVSLDDLDARPIKKGKRHPKTEFGTTLQMTFNRQGFMITTENFIGHPNDKTLYGPTMELFRSRIQAYPRIAITDQGFRSTKNLKLRPEGLKHVFMGRSNDVGEDLQDTCLRARSATEGFIAVAKHLRGFGRSLYRGLKGTRIWTLLNQSAYNLKKFLQLYRNEDLEERTLVTLGLL